MTTVTAAPSAAPVTAAPTRPRPQRRRAAGRRTLRRGGGRAAVDASCLVGATAWALTPLLPVFGARAVLPAIVGGLLLGLALAVVGAWRRWSALGVLAAVLVVYLVAGGALAAPTTTLRGVLPGAGTAAALARGIVTAWSQVVTLQPPLGSGGTLLVAPFVLALVGATVAVTLALRAARPGTAALAALVPVGVAVAAALLGTRTPPVPPAVTGTVLLVVLGGWASWRAGLLRPRRVLALALVLAVAVGAGAVGGARLVDERPRFVLRDEIVPPFDPNDYPSPLAAFRAFVKDEDTVMFTVSGLPEGARIRLATLDRYDGVVWNVAGGGTAQASGEFRRVGELIPTSAAGQRATIQVQVRALSGVWLPTVGRATGIDVAGADASGLRFNDATGAAVLTGGVHDGLRYTLDVVVPATPTVVALGATPAASVALPQAVGEPSRIDSLAPQIARDAGNPAEVAQALSQWLVENGYFSHGLSGEESSLSGHGAARLAGFLESDVIVGDGEQYAATMALLARSMGLPARVVLGFVPGSAVGGDGTPTVDADGAVEVTGGDVQAWVEVAFAGYGWVPFDATPPAAKTVDPNPDPKPADPLPQVVQPPPPAQPDVAPPDDDTAQPDSMPDPDPDRGHPTWLVVLGWTGVGAAGLLVLLSPVLVIGALKVRRRRRRRRAPDPVTTVAGGWDEVMDAAVDLRRPPAPRATRREAARAVAASFLAAPSERRAPVATALVGLADRADRAVFRAGVPTPDEVGAFWAEVQRTATAMRASATRRERLRARYSTASLRRGGR